MNVYKNKNVALKKVYLLTLPWLLCTLLTATILIFRINEFYLNYRQLIRVVSVVITLIVFYFTVVFPYFRHINFKVTVEGNFIERQTGFINLKVKTLKKDNVNKIVVKQGKFDKKFGISTVILYCGKDTYKLKNVCEDFADALVSFIGL